MGAFFLECGNGSNCYVDDPLFYWRRWGKVFRTNADLLMGVIGADAFGFMDNFSVGILLNDFSSFLRMNNGQSGWGGYSQVMLMGSWQRVDSGV